jgi:hypothetical protein
VVAAVASAHHVSLASSRAAASMVSDSVLDPNDSLGERSFLPNGIFAISWRIGSSEDVVPSSGNDFYHFYSLSSFISYHVIIFACVALHLLGIETIINVTLGLPLNNGYKGTKSVLWAGFTLPVVTGLTGLDRLRYRPVTNRWVQIFLNLNSKN